jgi:arylformamidase
MPLKSPAWHDHQYNNRARIPQHPAILAHWTAASEQARARLAGHLDLRYGDGEGETLDLFPAQRPGAPVLIYIHGGYWRALDKRDHSFVAPAFVDAGAMVVLPNYALCPAVSVEHIVMQMVRAVAWVHRHAQTYGGDPERIVVAGHSAGGHLATMLLCCRWPEVAAGLPAGLVDAALSVSGVFDLEPLRHAPFLAPDLGLTEATARRLSPACLPRPDGRLVAVVGGDESEEFLRQHRLIARRWGRQAVPVCETVPGRHHMDVLGDLADPSARVHQLGLSLLGLRALPHGRPEDVRDLGRPARRQSATAPGPSSS